MRLESSMNSPERPVPEQPGRPRRIHAGLCIPCFSLFSQRLYPTAQLAAVLRAVVVSFLAAPAMIGVTSMCRFWQGHEAIYQGL